MGDFRVEGHPHEWLDSANPNQALTHPKSATTPPRKLSSKELPCGLLLQPSQIGLSQPNDARVWPQPTAFLQLSDCGSRSSPEAMWTCANMHPPYILQSSSRVSARVPHSNKHNTSRQTNTQCLNTSKPAESILGKAGNAKR